MNLFGLSITRRKASVVPVRSQQGLLGYIRESFTGAWQQGVTLDNRETILAFSAVYACVTRIASDIAKLRIRLVRMEDGVWVEVDGNSPFWRPLVKPNGYQTRIQFIINWIVSKLLYGNAYILKERADLRGMVTALHVLDPRRVMPLVTADGSVYYQLGNDQLAKVTSDSVIFPASEIIHDRGVTLFHPLVGTSPLYACAMSATQGNRIQSNSATFFQNMSRPSGMITAPGTIADETAERIKSEWEKNFQAGNIGRLAVMGDGLTYAPMTISADDAQLIEQLKWTGEDCARAFGVPGYKIGVGPMPTNNNVEALEQQYYSGCLQIFLEAMELCLDEGLGMGPGMGTEFDLDGLLRMDSAAMYEALGKGVGAAILKPNEARKKLNLPPVAGGDTPYLQQQNYSLAALQKRDQTDDPFGKSAPAPAAAAPAAPAAADPAPAKGIDEERFASMMQMLEQQATQVNDLLAAVREKAASATPAADPDDEFEVCEALAALTERFKNAEAVSV